MKKRTLLYITAALIILTATAAILWNMENNKITKAFMETDGEIVVIFNRDISGQHLSSLGSELGDSVKVERHIGDYALLKVTKQADYPAILGKLEKNADVKTVQANNSIYTMKTGNDPYFDTQWPLHNGGMYLSYNNSLKQQVTSTKDVDMEVTEAWDYLDATESEKREVVIAIIDTGIDYKHPDLEEHIWINEDEIPEDGEDNDNNGYVDDIYGWDFYNNDSTIGHYKYDDISKLYLADPKDNDDHGTHIAGIIGAAMDNNIGIAGIASNIDVKLMILKINGGPSGTGSISNAIEAIKYATMMGADICNLSWGTSEYTAALEEMLEESDMLFVAAAGNSGTDNNDSPIYPASLRLPNLLSVTYVDANGALTALSNYGNRTVDIAAPGEDIYSTVVGGYSAMSGSSMAAPQISAVAAFLYAINDNIYASNVKELILENIKPLPELAGQLLSPGIPNAYLMLQAAESQLKKDTEPPELTVETIHNKDKILIPIRAEDAGGSGIRVILWQSGEKALSDFNRGMTGTLVSEHQLTLDKAGIYTFYVGDYAGNETLLTYEVLDDITPPKLKTSYTVSDSYKTRTVTVRASDEQSSIKRVKYLEGKKEASDFLPAGAGTKITLKNGKGTFKVKKDGIYSIYAIDNRGNITVKQVEVQTVKAADLLLTRTEKTMDGGDKYFLRAFMKPANTTDRITYQSSDETVATITDSGIIKAQKVGKTTITAKTSSGKTAVCVITVRKV